VFDEIIETHVKPDGEVEVKLVQPDPEEMVAAVADLNFAWRRFRDIVNVRMDAALDPGRAGINWWRALDALALADSRLKEAFICGDRSPASINQYAKFKRKIISGERYRTDA
jgi:hypothetical protein